MKLLVDATGLNGKPVNLFKHKPIEQPKEKGCIKPNCDCVKRAIEANGGNDVKSYPCLHSNAHEAEKQKSGNYNKSFAEAISKFITPELIEAAEKETVEDTTMFKECYQFYEDCMIVDEEQRFLRGADFMAGYSKGYEQSTQDHKHIIDTQSSNTESVEQAAEKEYPFTADSLYNRSLQNSSRIAFKKGANWQKHQSNQEVIDVIEARIKSLDQLPIQHVNRDFNDYTIEILTELLTKIKIR